MTEIFYTFGLGLAIAHSRRYFFAKKYFAKKPASSGGLGIDYRINPVVSLAYSIRPRRLHMLLNGFFQLMGTAH
jgi:hypothetical protein